MRFVTTDVYRSNPDGTRTDSSLATDKLLASGEFTGVRMEQNPTQAGKSWMRESFAQWWPLCPRGMVLTIGEWTVRNHPTELALEMVATALTGARRERDLYVQIGNEPLSNIGDVDEEYVLRVAGIAAAIRQRWPGVQLIAPPLGTWTHTPPEAADEFTKNWHIRYLTAFADFRSYFDYLGGNLYPWGEIPDLEGLVEGRKMLQASATLLGLTPFVCECPPELLLPGTRKRLRGVSRTCEYATRGGSRWNMLPALAKLEVVK